MGAAIEGDQAVEMMPPSRFSGDARHYRLTGIKLLHTAVWALLAGCVLALPVAAFTRQFRWALVLTAIIIGECAVLAANGPMPIDGLGGSLHRRPGGQLRHLPTQLVGSIQQSDLRHAVRGE